MLQAFTKTLKLPTMLWILFWVWKKWGKNTVWTSLLRMWFCYSNNYEGQAKNFVSRYKVAGCILVSISANFSPIFKFFFSTESLWKVLSQKQAETVVSVLPAPLCLIMIFSFEPYNVQKIITKFGRFKMPLACIACCSATRPSHRS